MTDPLFPWLEIFKERDPALFDKVKTLNPGDVRDIFVARYPDLQSDPRLPKRAKSAEEFIAGLEKSVEHLPQRDQMIVRMMVAEMTCRQILERHSDMMPAEDRDRIKRDLQMFQERLASLQADDE